MLNLNLNLNAGSLCANGIMLLVFVLLLARELRPVLIVNEYTTVKRTPFRNSTHPMQTFGFYLAVDYCGEILKRVPPS